MSGLACADGVPVTCNPRVNLGGDQAMTGSCNCVEGCNSHFPCPKCLAPKTEMCELDLQKVKAYAVRTRDQIHTYSHTKLGAICPGCDLKIVEKVDDPKTQVRLAKLGDPAPPVPAAKRGKGVTHSSLHKSIVHGQRCVFNLEPEDWTTCLLHLDLIQKGALLQKTLLDQIGKVKVPNQDTSQSQANIVVLLLGAVAEVVVVTHSIALMHARTHTRARTPSLSVGPVRAVRQMGHCRKKA